MTSVDRESLREWWATGWRLHHVAPCRWPVRWCSTAVRAAYGVTA